MYRTFLTAFILFLASTPFFAQSPDCGKFKTGKFVYPNLNDKYSLRKASTQESYNNGKLEMIWKVKWLSDCEYELTCKETFVENCPFTKGDRINAKIVATEGECYQIESAVYFTKAPDGIMNPLAWMCKEE